MPMCKWTALEHPARVLLMDLRQVALPGGARPKQCTAVVQAMHHRSDRLVHLR